MANITFEQVIAGDPPIGGDSGEQFANKINNNFAKLTGQGNASSQALSTPTANIYNLSGVNANADKALSMLLLRSAFIAFCGNVNSNSLDAAFGKNTEEFVYFLGKQLAMCGWFKGDDKVANPFTTLMTKNTLAEICASSAALNELTLNILDVINSSPYAKALVKSVYPLPGSNIVQTNSNASTITCSNTYPSRVYQIITSITVATKGYYTLSGTLYSNTYLYWQVWKNGSVISDLGSNKASFASTNFFFNSGDVVEFRACYDYGGSGGTYTTINPGVAIENLAKA
jgi:uncharacterized protein (UPF0333 family)